ncbi:hypothetical protein RFI_15873 [Reticulomyxa filosa]|uniref:Uncharacterized protein n=1 Tax=Reticulomyxa filosa TaxID=46433 RepID=X6N5X6_RETFI|nr:hypothetical protein RFI_15873 [Reticulomyxa filosa]|eukprot:ETO21333.1 hypothetical protein RFI_15873 [Reticulomyxa filosa]
MKKLAVHVVQMEPRITSTIKLNVGSEKNQARKDLGEISNEMDDHLELAISPVINLLIKEWGHVYRNVHALCHNVLESLQFEMDIALNPTSVEDEFRINRRYFIRFLYKAFPPDLHPGPEKRNQQVLKTLVNDVAFKYGDILYLVFLCSFKRIPASRFADICCQRFIKNIQSFKYDFMKQYLRYHEGLFVYYITTTSH